jgi:magnesium-protoporphyrin O-methyltransferase
MSACCSAFARAAEQQFSQAKAAEELKQFRKTGPGPTTRLLAEGIAQTGALSGSVLDIGSGIGALTFTLLERGATVGVAVDASPAYLAAAREEAKRRGRADAIRFVHADFVEASTHLPSARIVTLDRVVCCYPSCELLLAASLEHAERCLAISYPRDVWYVRLGMMLENGQRRLTRNSFRTFVHPAAQIQGTIERAGFRLSSRRKTWMWAADVYVRQ